ncbi:MAG: DUF3136 domain-containing protein [Cyanobacteria bacterium M_surface_10_m1_298]|nr:DUF3136 domain-containing protein [Cyanobacteria bacterium M_surface_10_m1_298]
MVSSETYALTFGELEAKYPLYCKAMRILIRAGKDEAQVRRTLCWSRLAILHHSIPQNYRDPHYLYLMLRRQVHAPCDPDSY